MVNLTCIGCPMGCSLTVEMEGKTVVSVTGNGCRIGDRYARKELTDPTRIVTSTVKVRGGRMAVVSVKTARDIPKGKMLECARCLREVEADAPISIGQVVLQNVAGTGVDVIATRNVERA